jgi:translation initiation factor IF-2
MFRRKTLIETNHHIAKILIKDHFKSKWKYLTAIKNLNNTNIETPKISEDDIIHLINPMTVVRQQPKLQLTKLSGVSSDILIPLSTRPLQKPDKWTKKNGKNDDREPDLGSSKLRLKKKIRSKVSFEEDLESVTELLDQTALDLDTSLLSTARPIKPSSTHATAPVPRQKTDLKKNIPSQGYKKEVKALVREKPTKLMLAQSMTIEDFSEISLIPKTEIIKFLFLKGVKVTLNQHLDVGTIQKVGQEFGIEIEITEPEDKNHNKLIELTKDSEGNLKPRPPIITIIGHVDHGKTTLLDKIQKTQIAQKEAGGMTQKIGAYEVTFNYKDKTKQLVFLDTPGHEAFSGMRSRGISIADIVVLVVAADTGLTLETIEIIKYLQSKNTPILAAINKIDKKESNVDAIKKELAAQSLLPEDWGGDTITVPISAMQGTNIDILLEMICLLSEMLNLQADPKAPGKGLVLDSNIDKTKGPLASVIVQNGTLHIGDTIVLDKLLSKIRGITNYLGEDIKQAYPSSPVLVWGLPKVPSIGDQFFSFQNEKDAKAFANSKTSLLTKSNSLQQLNGNRSLLAPENKEQIKLIIKTDTQGSSEAIITTLNKLSNSKIQILHCSPGEVTETDAAFACTTKSILIAFNTTSTTNVKKACKTSNVTLKDFNIIYDLLEYVKLITETLSNPQQTEILIGSGLVKTVFPLAKTFVAGTLVVSGKIINSSWLHIIRNEQTIYKGSISSLKKLKDDVKEVVQGEECGIFINDFSKWSQGDIINAFELSTKKKVEK